MLALSQDMQQNRPVEAREHIRRFHELFFSLSPDKSAIESNVQRPYEMKAYCRQHIIRSSSVTERSLVTTCRLRNVTRSDNNPQGFLIESFTIIENRDIGQYER